MVRVAAGAVHSARHSVPHWLYQTPQKKSRQRLERQNRCKPPRLSLIVHDAARAAWA